MSRAVVAAATLVSLCAAPPAPPAPCAALCQCRGDHFSCDAVPFHRFPTTGAGVRHVAVWGARLGALDEAALDARALRTLVLANSQLHVLHPAALTSMASSLASLDLGYNELTELPLAALRRLKVLNWLNLQNNLIDSVPVGSEWGALGDCLSSLSLAHNQLAALAAGTLAPLRRLASLDLEGNRLHALAPAALPASLVLLHLSDNLLPALPCSALALLLRLRHLHLRGNPLRPVPGRACAAPAWRLDSLDLSQSQLNDLFALKAQRLRLRRLSLDLNEFTALPQFALEGGRLERLSAAHNRLVRVSDATLHALRTLERLELDHNELRALGEGVRELARMRHLSLAYNHLERLKHLPPSLRSLALAGNLLARFPAGLCELEPATLLHLDLGYNRIAAIAATDFGPWAKALATLGLKGNRIVELAADAFPATMPLRELALGYNELYRVAEDALANLTQLHALELSAALASGHLPRAPTALRWLAADSNRLHRLVAAFGMLEYVNLDYNELVEYPSGSALARECVTKELRLAYNYLSRVDGPFLRHLAYLQSLDLSYNRIEIIHEGDFSNLPNLAFLTLAGNQLRSVGAGAFRALPRLAALDLRDNQLREFSMRWLQDVASEDTELAVNASRNYISMLEAGGAVCVHALDLSHNRLQSVPVAFFAALPLLRRLSLAHNQLALVDGTSFGALPALLELDLSNNVLGAARRRAFADMPALRSLDLSCNRLGQLATEQFAGLHHLFRLSLAGNRLGALPRDCFRSTVLEYLDLTDNLLAVYPSSALAAVGVTLRGLQLAGNRLAHLDAAMFRATPDLHDLGLARNALTALADRTFTPLARLLYLDLSENALKANFKELFLALPQLRRLALADAGLRAVPPLPLAALVDLDLGGNELDSFRETDVHHLAALRRLRLAGNRLTALQPAMWAALPRLTDLDVSANPLVRIARASFEGLERLQRLRLERLFRLEALEPRALLPLHALRSLALELPLAGGAALADVAACAPALEELALTVHDVVLDAQLLGVVAPRLRALDVRGVTLRHLSVRAFTALERQRALTLRVRGTALAALPAGLARPLARVPLLALDFSDNRLESFSPAVLYPNLSDWQRLGTRLLPGGLALGGNALRCSCGVAWLGAWLRRWAGEVGAGGAGARARAGAPRCASGVALVSVRADAAACAVSSRAPRAPPPRLLWLVLLYSLSYCRQLLELGHM